MALVGNGSGRSTVSAPQRRRAYLKHTYECGFQDGYYSREPSALYKADEEAQSRYLIGLRIGQREKRRDAA